MPFIETPTDLAETIADQLGIYGAHEDSEVVTCRVCFVPELVKRIRDSVENEKRVGTMNSQLSEMRGEGQGQ